MLTSLRCVMLIHSWFQALVLSHDDLALDEVEVELEVEVGADAAVETRMLSIEATPNDDDGADEDGDDDALAEERWFAV